ncbi:MAG: internal scaffolding protein [Microvirus sp.]|nr:MAG: internal scaffolding protein [Microvirus sp.]
MFVRNPYNYDVDAVSLANGLACEDASMTQQQFKDETDINEIVRRFGVTGVLPNVHQQLEYAQFDDIVDYHTAATAIVEADARFMELPSALRARFNNSPQAFLEFCGDGRNRLEAERLGLVKPSQAPQAPHPTPTPTSTPSAPPTAS